MTDLVAVIFVFGGATLVLLAISPIGRALADRIRGARPVGDEAIQASLAELRGELVELAERVDFVERLSAGRPEARKVSPP